MDLIVTCPFRYNKIVTLNRNLIWIDVIYSIEISLSFGITLMDFCI